MSRAAPSLTRTLAASSSRSITPLHLSRRTLIGDATRPTASTVSGSTTSVDPRILGGIPSFLPKQNVDMLCEWQSGLWTRLQAEVRSTWIGLLILPIGLLGLRNDDLIFPYDEDKLTDR